MSRHRDEWGGYDTTPQPPEHLDPRTLGVGTDDEEMEYLRDYAAEHAQQRIDNTEVEECSE